MMSKTYDDPLLLLKTTVFIFSDTKSNDQKYHNCMQEEPSEYGSGHGTVAVLLPGFAINW